MKSTTRPRSFLKLIKSLLKIPRTPKAEAALVNINTFMFPFAFINETVNMKVFCKPGKIFK